MGLAGGRRFRASIFFVSIAIFCFVLSTQADTQPTPAEKFPGAAKPPAAKHGWEKFQTQVDPDASKDEASRGLTKRGTPVRKRTLKDMPAEPRNIFYEVDQVYNTKTQKLEPIPYDGSPEAQNAIRGQNTWLLWGGGNEVFWAWLQEDGYGLHDFLVLLDSRDRHKRFDKAGLMNQPGMVSRSQRAERILGLYLDGADGQNILYKAYGNYGTAPYDQDAYSYRNGEYQPYSDKNPPPFEVADEAKAAYEQVLKRLPRDGVNPDVYGYPSGVIGLRLWPNPDYFGNSEAAKKARGHWNKQVIKPNNDKFYDIQSKIQADPKLVRPFRISMSCSFCHIAPHPLNPPAKPEAPAWSELSSTIGNQYWVPRSNFGRLLDKRNLIYHLVQAEQPGTIDASLVSTDQINNPNTIISIYGVPPRMTRAELNPAEKQSAANQLLKAIEGKTADTGQRYTPRVLIDGSDSTGIHAGISRVYPNIGMYSEEWLRVHNPIFGFRPQSPLSVAAAQSNSVNWQASQQERVGYLASFFTYENKNSAQKNVTASMKLEHAPGGKAIVEKNREAAQKGRSVFVRNCAICHSSKQPEKFELFFSRAWETKSAPKSNEAPHYTLPMDFVKWEEFKKSAPYADYVRRIEALAANDSSAGPDSFFTENYLSTDIRVPVTLVGTNSARAVGTNAMAGQVWDNFSSDDYKALPAVGAVRFYNPYSNTMPDASGNNDDYAPPPGGPGYYRPASLISLWATGPYLHNNSLGAFTRDPSVASRLDVFEDGIDKLLWKKKREERSDKDKRNAMERGDFRPATEGFTVKDQGWIYRTSETSYLTFSKNFVRPLLANIIGPVVLDTLAIYLPLALGLVFAWLAWIKSPRHAGIVLLFTAVLLAFIIALTRLDRVYDWIWIAPVALVALTLWLWVGEKREGLARLVLAVASLSALTVGTLGAFFVHGHLVGIKIGPFPKGMPVNLIVNMSPEAPLGVKLDAVSGLLRGMLLAKRELPTELEVCDATCADQSPEAKRWVAKKQRKALRVFEEEAGAALLKASKCPDFVLDRGHWFAESLSDEDKNNLKAFLRTL